MSSEGDEVRGHAEYELKMNELEGHLRAAKVKGSVAIAGDDLTGWRVEAYDENGVRVLPRVWPVMEQADAFALGFLEGLDQGMINAVNVLAELGIIDKGRIEILPQQVKEGPPDGNDD